MSLLSELQPSGNLDFVLDNGTIVGQSPMRGGHPDCELPPQSEVDAFMADMQFDQAKSIVETKFEEESAGAMRYVKRHYQDAMVAISQRLSVSDLDGKPVTEYTIGILNPQFQMIGFGKAGTIADATKQAVCQMMDNDYKPSEPAAA